MDLNDFDRNELYELYKFLYRLNPNIMWESFLMEKKENIKTLFDFLKIIKYKIWKDKSLSYDYIMPREKVFEHYMELIYGEYLLKRQHTGLVVVIPDLQNCYYPDKVKECIELKLSVLRSIVNLTHMYYQEVVKNDNSRDRSRDNAKNGMKNETKNETKNKSKNKSRDKSENKSRDNANKNKSRDKSENKSRDNVTNGLRDKSKNGMKNETENESENKSENKSRDKSENGINNETKNKSENKLRDKLRDKSNKNKSKNETKNGSRTNTIEDIIENKVNFALENAIVTFDMTLFGSTTCLHDPIYCENDSEKTSKRIRLIKIFCFMLFIGVDLSEIEIILRECERYVVKN